MRMLPNSNNKLMLTFILQLVRQPEVTENSLSEGKNTY